METRDIALIKALSNGAGGASYTLPVASSATLGGVKPSAKTDTMTQEVGVDENGGLWTAPGGGGSGQYDEYTVIAEGGEKFVGFSFSELGLSDYFDASMIELVGHNLGYQSETLTNNQKALIKVNAGTYAYGGVCTTRNNCISNDANNPRNSFFLVFIPGLNKESGLCFYRECSIDNVTSNPGYSDNAIHIPISNSYASGFYVCPVGTSSDSTWLAGSTFKIRVWR